MRIWCRGGVRPGAASRFEIESAAMRLMWDCGVEQFNGHTNLLDCGDMREPTVSVDSHAHLDHCGARPRARRRWPNVPHYATRLTLDQEIPLFNDALGLMRMGETDELYTQDDIDELIMTTRIAEIGKRMDVGGGCSLTLDDNGHLPGNVWGLLETPKEKVAIVTDTLLAHQYTVGGAHFPKNLPPIDVLLVECTNGNSPYPRKPTSGTFASVVEQARERFRCLRAHCLKQSGAHTDLRNWMVDRFVEKVFEVHQRGGNVCCPTFASRVPELVATLLMHNIHPVYVDGLGKKMLEVAKNHGLLNEAYRVSGHTRSNPRVIPIENETMREAVFSGSGATVLASNAWLRGGPAPAHCARALEGEKNAVIFPGYVKPGSIAAELTGKKKGDTIALPVGRKRVGRGNQKVWKTIWKEVMVHAGVCCIRTSCHEPQEGLGDIITIFSPRITYLIHGDESAMNGFLRYAAARPDLAGRDIRKSCPGLMYYT